MGDWRQVDCRLAITDSPLGEQPETVPCPKHQDTRRPNMAIYADHAYCYVCGFYLKRLPTLALLLYGNWDEAAMLQASRVAEKYTPASLDAYRKRVEENVKQDPLPFGLAMAYNNLLYGARTKRLDWLWDRGITDLSIQKFMLGHDGTRFTIPVQDQHGALLTFRFRRDDYYGTTQFDPKRGEDRVLPKYSGMSGRNGLFLYTHPYQMHKFDWAVVVEGELDAVLLWQKGIPAVSPTNGAGNVPRVPALIKRDFPGVTRLFFATDQDEPGANASIEGFAAALREGFSVTRLTWDPHRGKDVTELYLGGHSLKDAIYEGDERELP